MEHEELPHLYSEFLVSLERLQQGLKREKTRLIEERAHFEAEKQAWHEKNSKEANPQLKSQAHSIESLVDDKFDANHRSHGMEIIGNGKEAVQNTGKDHHEFVIGSKEFSEGRICWTFKIEYMCCNEWIFLGIQDSASLPDPSVQRSFSNEGCYGWSTHGRCIGGELKSPNGTEIELQFQEGDLIDLILDCNASYLEIRNSRYNDKKFFLDIPYGRHWKLHVNLFSLGDRIQLVHTTTKQSLAQ